MSKMAYIHCLLFYVRALFQKILIRRVKYLIQVICFIHILDVMWWKVCLLLEFS